MSTKDSQIAEEVNPDSADATGGNLRSALEISTHALLEKFKSEKNSESEAPEEDADFDMELPSDAVAANLLMQEILRGEPADETGQKIKKLKLAKVRAHLHELEQGPAAPQVPVATMLEMSRPYTASSDLRRLSEIAVVHSEIKEIINRCLAASGFISNQPATEKKSSAPQSRDQKVWARVRSEISDAATECLERCLEQRASWDDASRHSMLPNLAAHDCGLLQRALTVHCRTIEETKTLCGTIGVLREIADCPALQHEAKRRCNGAFLSLATPIETMISAATASLETQISEAVSAEREFLAAHGFPHEPTSVSRSLVALNKMIQLRYGAFKHQSNAVHNNPGSENTPRIDINGFDFLFSDCDTWPK